MHLILWTMQSSVSLNLFLDTIKQMIIFPQEKSSVTEPLSLCLRAQDSSNYPGQQGDDYAVVLPLCTANYTSRGNIFFLNFYSQPINTPVASFDSQFLS